MRGWEGGILRFLAARFAEKHGFWGSIREAVQVGVCIHSFCVELCCAVLCCRARFAEKHGFWGSIREAVQVRSLTPHMPLLG